MAPLLKELGEVLFSEIEFVQADLLDDASIDSAIEGADYVVHIASPVPTGMPKNADEVIKPAVQGTISVMKAASKYKIVRVVLTSSTAAVQSEKDKAKVSFGPEDWADEKEAPSYVQSKILAERAAWDFRAKLPDEDKFELVVINPATITGPTLCGGKDFFSGELLKMIMLGKIVGLIPISIGMVDV